VRPFKKRQAEGQALKAYNAALKEFTKQLGNGVTYNMHLNDVGKHLWPKKFTGVYASDDTIPKSGYCIVNVDKRHMPGSHWIAICGGDGSSGGDGSRSLVYDSFGRKTSKLTPHMLGKFQDTDYDAEQKDSEENCGSRCLAWIHVYDTMGRAAAKLI
jgi:hypothetical protein